MSDLILAWHGDPALKERALERMREHAAADRLTRGMYIDVDMMPEGQWQGCLHGCLVAEDVAAEGGTTVPALAGTMRKRDWWQATEERWGIPAEVGQSLDDLYELTDGPPGDLAVRILEAIPVGADLQAIADDLYYSRWNVGQALAILRGAPIPQAAA